jgi:hypothetical protein
MTASRSDIVVILIDAGIIADGSSATLADLACWTHCIICRRWAHGGLFAVVHAQHTMSVTCSASLAPHSDCMWFANMGFVGPKQLA